MLFEGDLAGRALRRVAQQLDRLVPMKRALVIGASCAMGAAICHSAQSIYFDLAGLVNFLAAERAGPFLGGLA